MCPLETFYYFRLFWLKFENYSKQMNPSIFLKHKCNKIYYTELELLDTACLIHYSVYLF